ncbi:MAG: hypothetical protein A3B07_03295 [Candidatus Yonathbacteria bacterium RIFCSPLOWO2_01_FULL_43_27]|uniref:Uncharacterized protein n=1 Tax=Candidatus Yonathbacteria bacterium RIFCSPLOWO2_01_FULL_43_27 TaxID=1802726 RepID=A0A1G2SCX3_9BACT|nr:MAG: hypothetical protein A3B07_03295 [Candidatus Yonathbacteria bacterium RIFCSPLOWO2_01_FULL_43_27]
MCANLTKEMPMSRKENRAKAKAKRKSGTICNGCGKNRDVRGHCWTCVSATRDHLYERFLATLRDDQQRIFFAYQKVREQFISMVILD